MTALARAVDLDLDAYRPDHVQEHVRRALARERVVTVGALTGLVAADAEARRRFVRSLAMPVTSLFRDPWQFDLLERKLLPPLLARGNRIGVWSAGCADGSELYSIAILLERLGALDRANLLGSDLLDENIVAARRSTCLPDDAPSQIRRAPRFERRDLLRDGAPPGRWRLILCRNVGIYLTDDAKRSLHELLADALGRDGVLLLGRSERIADPSALGLERAAPHAYRRST